MNKRAVSGLLAVAAIGAVAIAAKPAGNASVPPGRYLLYVNEQPILLSVQGSTITSELLQVLTIAVGPTPPPPVPPTPTPPTTPPDVPDGFAGQIASWALEVNEPVIASALGQSFGVLADKIESGQIRGAGKTADTTKQVVDIVLRASSKRDEWQTVRNRINAELGQRQTRGELATHAQVVTAYREIRDGFASASVGTQALNLQVIIKLVLAVLSGDPAAIADAVVELIEAIGRR